MLAKIWEEENAPAVQEELVATMAWLELMLPTDWNTQVRHMLLCRFVKQLNKFGSFWCQCMLSIESYHALVKGLGRSRKNLIVSFLNNYQIFDITSLEWRFDDENLAHVADHSALSRCQPSDWNRRDVSLCPRQATRPTSLGDMSYMQIIRLYCQCDPDFLEVVQEYERDIEASGFVYLDQWKPPVGTLLDCQLELLKDIMPVHLQSKVKHNTCYKYT
jgi:hypothetical protein